MCKYCRELNTGDCNESILEGDIPVLSDKINLDVFINDDELELYADTFVTDTELVKNKIKINFCPFCGEKLNKEEK